MPSIFSPNRLAPMATALLAVGLATPAQASGPISIGNYNRPITSAPFVFSSEYGTEGEGLVPNRITLAAGAFLGNDYEGSDHHGLGEAAAVEALVHGHLITWRGTSLGVDLVPEHRGQRWKFILAPFVDLNLDRTSRAHDPVVRLLGKLKPAAEGGVVLGFSKTGVILPTADRLTLQVSVSHDLGTVHRSYEILPSVGYVLPLSKAALISATASLDVVGVGYNRTYFGVTSAGSAASGLPAYTPGGGVKSASLGLGGLVSLRGDLRKGFAVGGLVNYERLLGAAADSPIVALRGNPNQFTAALGVAYTF